MQFYVAHRKLIFYYQLLFQLMAEEQDGFENDEIIQMFFQELNIVAEAQ